MTTLATPPPKAPRRLPAPLGSGVLRAAGSLALAAGAFGVQSWLGTHSLQPLLALAVFGAMCAIVLRTVGEHHPYPHFGAANHVTSLRAMLAALAASLIIEPAGAAVAWVIVLITTAIALLDGVDGWLARQTGMQSVFGARFDMETDAFFMLVLSVLVWRHDKAGIWVIAIGLMRYAFVAGGVVWPWLARPLGSTSRGKAVAVAQFVGLGVALLPIVPAPVSTLVCAAALTALVWSFAIDIHYLRVH